MKTCLRHTFIIVLVLALFNLQIGPNFEIRANQAEAQALQLEKLEGGGNNYMNLIMMLGVGIIAMTLVKRVVKPTTDIYIAAAGGAAFMAGELMSNDKGKKEVDQQNTDIKLSHDGTIDGNQLKSLEKLKESYQSVKKSAETKKMMQMAAAAAFGGAAVMAFMQKMTEEQAYAQCLMSIQTTDAKITTEKTTLTPICKNPQSAASNPSCITKEPFLDPCKGGISSIKSSIEKFKQTKERQGSTLAEVEALEQQIFIGPMAQCQLETSQYATEVQSSCTTYVKTLTKLHQSQGTGAQVGYLPQPQESKIERLISLIFPSAHAFDTKMLGLGIVGAGALMGFMSKSANMIDKFMNHPKNRAMVWAAMAALAFLASQSSAKEAQTAQSNIDKIDKLIQGMKSHTGGDTNPGAAGPTELAAVGTTEIGAINPALVKGANNMRIGNQPAVPCLAGQNSSGQCNSFSAQLDDSVKKSFSSGINPGVAGFASQIGKLADSIQGKSSLSSGALASAQSVAGKAATMGRLSDQAKKQLNDMLAKKGEAPVPFDQMQKGLLDNLQSNAVASLKSKGYTPSSGEMSSLSNGLQDLKHSTGEQNAAADKKDANATTGKITPAGSAISMGGNGKEKGMDFDFLNENAAPGAGIDPNAGITGPSPSSADALANFESDANNEINSQSHIPLWEIITVRYMKSGYPRLLDVDDKTPASSVKKSDK